MPQLALAKEPPRQSTVAVPTQWVHTQINKMRRRMEINFVSDGTKMMMYVCMYVCMHIIAWDEARINTCVHLRKHDIFVGSRNM
jgi:hypothetical protein